MCKFYNINNNNIENFISYLPQIHFSYSKYYKYIQDDFSNNTNIISYIKSVSPYFWMVTDFYNNYMGFIALDNFTGNNQKLYSAEITTIYDQKAWGIFPRYSGKIFLKKSFDELGLYKICAKVYPDNFRVKTLLKKSGFNYETTLKAETLRNGKPQDIEIFAIYRTYFYKNEGK